MKKVLITGGSRGIGAAMVRLFSSRGYMVAFTYKNSKEAAEKLSSETGAYAIKADAEIEEEILSAVRYAKDALGGIDVLINNAAISDVSLFTDVSLERWNQIFSVNVGSAFLYSREVLREMIAKKSGRIINISSMWGVCGASCEVAYSASKAALIGMTKALAKEVGPSGITVNAIAPGVINTEMNSHLQASDIESLENETPLMRIGEPSEIAEAAFFLASDSAAFITGETLNVNGGIVI